MITSAQTPSPRNRLPGYAWSGRERTTTTQRPRGRWPRSQTRICARKGPTPAPIYIVEKKRKEREEGVEKGGGRIRMSESEYKRECLDKQKE